MKKIKIMFMALVVIGAMGGALAFKAKSYSTGLFFGTTNDNCPTESQGLYKIASPRAAYIQNLYCTDNSQQADVCLSVTDE